MITSPRCCRPLNGLFRVIGIDFYPTSRPAANFATEPQTDIFFRSAQALSNLKDEELKTLDKLVKATHSLQAR
jgi:hypothetical protein